jgi:hypothetical protein
MKTIIIIAALFAAQFIQAQTVTRCTKTLNGDVVCTTTSGGGGF